MLVIKALHGIPESGKNWATKFGAIMKEEGWEISKADPKAWMKRNGNHYECVGSCVDDLIAAAADPQAFFDCLREKHELRLKGDAPLRYHLGCNFGRDPDGTSCQSAKQCAERMHDNYTRLAPILPSHRSRTLVKALQCSSTAITTVYSGNVESKILLVVP